MNRIAHTVDDDRLALEFFNEGAHVSEQLHSDLVGNERQTALCAKYDVDQ